MDTGDLDDDPLRQLSRWVDDARAAGDVMPEAMCVATATATGDPSARMVLMRGLDAGVVFYTDYSSDKGKDLDENPRAAAVLYLTLPVRRQVRLRGPVERTTDEESDRYWRTRPVASRRSAVVSKQSSVIGSRSDLDHAVAALGDIEPDRPARWGGFRIRPEIVEFWEEGPNRLHDRIRFTRRDGGWLAERLSP